MDYTELKFNQIKIKIKNKIKLKTKKVSIIIAFRYQEVSSGFNSESNEKSEKLLKRIGVFDNWLELALQQLNFYQNSNDDVQFDDLLQREQGLKVGLIFEFSLIQNE